MIFFEDDLTGVAIAIGCGGLLYLSSIPVFLASSRIKRLGMKTLAYIKIEEVPPAPGIIPMHNVYPSGSVDVTF